jgi:hypothetical protein
MRQWKAKVVRRWKVFAVVCAALVVVGTGAATLVPHSSPSEVQGVTYYGDPFTVTVGATGDASTAVSYTCASSVGKVKTCTATIAGGVWSKKVTVPQGTVVRVQAHGGVLSPECWISDKDDVVVLIKSTDGVCQAVAE